MFARTVINTAKKLGITALFAAVAVVSVSAHGVEVRDHKNSLFHQDMTSVNALTPVHLMTDEQLFTAAAAQRDISMSDTLKRANHIWLRSFARRGSQGTSALRRFLRKGLSRYNDSAKIVNLKNDDEDNSKTDFEGIEKRRSYSVDVREDRMEFEMEYRF
jgi:hypothetical protein